MSDLIHYDTYAEAVAVNGTTLPMLWPVGEPDGCDVWIGQSPAPWQVTE